MFLKTLKFSYFLYVLLLLNVSLAFSQGTRTIEIDTTQGREIKTGSSGFNVRIADKVWSYAHPDFIKTVKELKPGWLRYFSGTMGDAFSSATGLYDIDYIHAFDHPEPFLKGHRFTDVKGPHRIVDLYNLLKDVNGKLIVTVNAFTETPEMVLELAKFCKNNNIVVETWQFCNEPYFYVPNRNRYWWNDGYDYAAKMQPYAKVIREVFPESDLALNYTWDGVWTFMKEIHRYQEEHGAYWNVFSKHSYAPHAGRKETLAEAYKRANTKLIEATSLQAMKDIEMYSWKDIPMVITEFGVWNKPLNGIYASIYNIEYVMRQMLHSNTEYVGAHEVSNKYYPLNGRGKEVENAFEKNLEIKTDTVLTGIRKDLEGKTYKIFNEAINSSEYLYHTNIPNIVQIPGLKETTADGMFAQTYKGNNGFNYLVVTNRSGESNQFQIKINNKLLKQDLITYYISADSLNTKDAETSKIIYKNGVLNIKPYSLSVAKWKTKQQKLEQPRIYNAEIEKKGIFLKWGEIPNATAYQIYYGTNPLNLDQTILVEKTTSVLVKNVYLSKNYFFKIKAIGNGHVSDFSEKISLKYELPKKPEIFKVSRRNNTVTLFWRSVPNTKGYIIHYIDENNKDVEIDASNVFGYRIKNLKEGVKYNFSVTGYNGLGKGTTSKQENVLVSSRIPLSPRNVSAIKKSSKTIEVKWFAQDKILENTTYNVYRGEKLHQFTKIATEVQDTVYVDTKVKKDVLYYYTVKACTEAGESNFYPNIATTRSLEKNNKLSIQSIETLDKGYLVKVNLNKLKLKEDYIHGVILNNISYLNVENVKILGTKGKSYAFEVFIPKSDMKQNSKYAIKAFVIKKGKRIESAIVNQYVPKNKI